MLLAIVCVVILLCAYDLLCFVCTPDSFRDKWEYTNPGMGIYLYTIFKIYEYRYGAWE